MNPSDGSGDQQWREVTRDRPCPVCEKPDWCSRSADGRWVACRREGRGATKTKADKNGGTYDLHKLAQDAPRPRESPPITTTKCTDPADADLLHQAYSLLLDLLKLSQKHREQLRRRRLTDEEIDRRQYRTHSMENRRTVAGVLYQRLGTDFERIPGFLKKRSHCTMAGTAGLLIPCRDSKSRIVALKIRQDVENDKLGKYTYLSSKRHGGPGPGAPVHVPLGVPTPCQLIRLTEGELKADIATILSGVPTLSIPGVGNWGNCIPLLAFEFGARTVRLAYDADARTNPHVAKPLRECADFLRSNNHKVELEVWDPSVAKGIDDLLALGMEPELFQGDAAWEAVQQIVELAGVTDDEDEDQQFVAQELDVEGIGQIRLELAFDAKKPQREIRASIGEVQHIDCINPASAISRERFVNKFAELAKLEMDKVSPSLNTAILELMEQAKTAAKSKHNLENGGTTEKPSQATLAYELAAYFELWHTPDNDAYATITVGQYRENWPVRSRGFKQYLSKLFYDQHGKAINSEALGAALNLVEAQALFESPQQPVFLRVAGHGGDVYLDLADPEWRAVKITADGWEVIAEPPVRFWRSKGMLSLPEPQRGGSIDEFRPFLNVSDDSWILAVAWLIAALYFRGPYPVLAFFAEHGSGKSSAGRFLRNLVDPSSVPLRGEPKDPRDFVIAAHNSWCLAYDNLSYIPPWLSDALCRLSTGGGFATRALYTDKDEVLFDSQRPLMLTSIEEVATRSDLLDRCLVVRLPTIGKRDRCQERKLERSFLEARPRILGALLDAVSTGLRQLPHTELSELPRLADFAVWVTAAETGLGWPPGTFMSAYNKNLAAANDVALESMPVGYPLLHFLEESRPWSGAANELLEALGNRVDEKIKAGKGWPKNARALSGQLKRLSPNLRYAGWNVEYDETVRPKTWRFQRDFATEDDFATDLRQSENGAKRGKAMQTAAESGNHDANVMTDAKFRYSSDTDGSATPDKEAGWL